MTNNEFAPDWNAMAVMVEEQQRMSKRIEELEAELAQPEPTVDGWPLYSGLPPVKVQDDWALGVGHLAINPKIVGYIKPKREWVGLTKTEFNEVTHNLEDLEDCWIAIEAKLKEKNNG